MLARYSGDLVRDSEQRLKAVLLGNVQVALELLGRKLVDAGLDFNQSRPGALSS
ncbi:MAG: hypothetical protein M3450_12910 [Actinomycetota bacterium]|nr:hypothetical protein [Actinomycetota bacterium]